MSSFKDFNIRSITYSIDINKISDEGYRLKVKDQLESIKKLYATNSVFVRTVRLNILPINENERLDKFLFLKKVRILAEFSKSIGIRWFNISFDLTNIDNKTTKVITSIGYDIIKKFSTAFINFIVANENYVNAFAAKQCAKVILDISKLSFNGYDNFRVGVSLNPAKNTPFFPFSYGVSDNSFSLAIEVSQGIIEYLKNNTTKSIDQNRIGITNSITPFIKFIDSVSNELERKEGIKYGGLDMSLAPYPDENVSVIEILQLLGLDEIGSSGTLFYTAYLTGILKSIIKDNDIKSAGFNGVMYSLLEDHLMCIANNKKLLTIDNIISYSTLCGCGLDMVPISGNILVEELASIILDVSAIAIRLDKPLGVRVLPIPNKEENEFTEFDMDFLTNTRVMKFKNLSINSELFENKSIKLLDKNIS